MEITYTWSIDSLPNYPVYEGKENVVFQVNWTLTGTDGKYTASEKGGVGVNYEPSQPYTPYNQLTQQQVMDWIQSIMLPETVDMYKGWIQKSIENQKEINNDTPPWS